LQFLAALLSWEAQSEVATNNGRIDLVAKTTKYIYIFEFKFNSNPEIVLKQIEDKHYCERYLNQSKQVVLVGIAFKQSKERLSIEWSSKTL
jgi:hypothetical protein